MNSLPRFLLTSLLFLTSCNQDAVNERSQPSTIASDKPADSKKNVFVASESGGNVPDCCKPSSDSCDFYFCLQNKNRCDNQDYPIGYGHKYCKRFGSYCDGGLTTGRARSWVRLTKLCLQKSLEAYTWGPDTGGVCDKLRENAFDSHPACYAYSGLCLLEAGELATVALCVDFKDSLSPEAQHQMKTALELCRKIYKGTTGSSLSLTSAEFPGLSPQDLEKIRLDVSKLSAQEISSRLAAVEEILPTLPQTRISATTQTSASGGSAPAAGSFFLATEPTGGSNDFLCYPPGPTIPDGFCPADSPNVTSCSSKGECSCCQNAGTLQKDPESGACCCWVEGDLRKYREQCWRYRYDFEPKIHNVFTGNLPNPSGEWMCTDKE